MWRKLLLALAKPLGKGFARWLFDDDGKAKPKSLEQQMDDRLRARRGQAAGAAAHRESRNVNRDGK